MQSREQTALEQHLAKYATVEQITRWLAERPCDACWHAEIPHRLCGCEPCEGTGFALPWASTECVCGGDTCLCGACTPAIAMGDGAHTDACACHGSGRVPKAGLGLEELMGHASSLGDFEDILATIKSEHIRVINEGGEPNYLLAVLMAMALKEGLFVNS